MSRTGRRPGTPDTRETILTAARRRFATRGYDATSVRAIATAAEVDPALVIHYFGTKEALFIAAAGLPAGISGLFGTLAALPDQDFGRTLVRSYLKLVDRDDSRNGILALVRPGRGAADRHRHAASRYPGRATRHGKPGRYRRAGEPGRRTVPGVAARGPADGI